MGKVKLLDKSFKLYISAEEIEKNVIILARQINNELKGEEVCFLGVLNGAFMFASDLLKQINLDCRTTFLKLASYSGTSSTGKVKQLIGINEDIKDSVVVVVEDIVDTGSTLEYIVKLLKEYGPKDIKIATMFMKPEAYVGEISIDYIGMKIQNEFVVGYGLDYEGYGRNLKDLYILESQN